MIFEKAVVEVISDYGTQALGFLILIIVLYRQDIRNNKREDRLYLLIEKAQSFNESWQKVISNLILKLDNLINENEKVYTLQKREHDLLEENIKDLQKQVRDRY